MAIGMAVVSLAAGAYNAWSTNQAAKAEAANIQRQAAATAEAQRASARAYERQSAMEMMKSSNEAFKAKEELKQGEVAQEKANIEQLKGEREAARRSRLLAQEIGQQYAQFAGNGFAVDASPTDTFGSIIRTTSREGQADISTILDNAKMNQWTYEEQKRTMQRNAANSLMGANNYVFSAQSKSDSAKDAYKAAEMTLANGRAAAKAARKAGRRGAWGAMLGGVGNAIGGYYSIAK